MSLCHINCRLAIAARLIQQPSKLFPDRSTSPSFSAFPHCSRYRRRHSCTKAPEFARTHNERQYERALFVRGCAIHARIMPLDQRTVIMIHHRCRMITALFPHSRSFSSGRKFRFVIRFVRADTTREWKRCNGSHSPSIALDQINSSCLSRCNKTANIIIQLKLYTTCDKKDIIRQKKN